MLFLRKVELKSFFGNAIEITSISIGLTGSWSGDCLAADINNILLIMNYSTFYNVKCNIDSCMPTFSYLVIRVKYCTCSAWPIVDGYRERGMSVVFESLMLLQISLANQGKSRQNSWSFIPISWTDIFNTPWRKGLILKIFLFLDAMHSIRIERNDSFDHLLGCLSCAMNFSNVAVTCIPSLSPFPHLVSPINFMESRMSVLYPPYICLYTM